VDRWNILRTNGGSFNLANTGQSTLHSTTYGIAVTVTVTVTELHSSTMFSEESCSVGLSKKMGFQLRSELLATVVR